MTTMSDMQDDGEEGEDGLSCSSLWRAGPVPQVFPTLNADLSVDVVIIGAGITGITAAAHIAGTGRTVAVLEMRRVGAGTTGHSTGNLYADGRRISVQAGQKMG